jgi:feruloyl esterase
MREILNGSETDLTPFLVDNGGKYLLYHGWADPLIPGEPTVDYYEGIVADTFGGDAEAAGENVRLFMVPGMGHCSDAGLGSASEWDTLAPIIEWVENGTPPESIVATHTNSDGVVDNERILCPWPLQPTYVGPMEDDAQNDPANWVASNFECLPQE